MHMDPFTNARIRVGAALGCAAVAGAALALASGGPAVASSRPKAGLRPISTTPVASRRPAASHPLTTLRSGRQSVKCSGQHFSQPFASSGDHHYYTLLPGESADNFDGTGWNLSGGAKRVSVTLADGKTGGVLDLPSHSRATSPAICVSSAYPLVRSMIADLAGRQGIEVLIQFRHGGRWGRARNMGTAKGPRRGAWGVTRSLRIHTASFKGAALARFVLVAPRHGQPAAQDYRVYNFYVDPKIKF
jgi:hypothetical protein